MTQRKLDNDELERVMCARNDIKQMCDWGSTDRGREYWYGVSNQLHAMALHATTDGQPYVDPEPPIPDGYRLAVAGDEVREDARWWDCAWQKWCVRAVSGVHEPFAESYHYIVPIDRTPTDDDAKSRPEVMVRDGDGQKWTKHTLIMVRDCELSKYKFATTSKMRIEIVCWKYARHLYPGE